MCICWYCFNVWLLFVLQPNDTHIHATIVFIINSNRIIQCMGKLQCWIEPFILYKKALSFSLSLSFEDRITLFVCIFRRTLFPCTNVVLNYELTDCITSPLTPFCFHFTRFALVPYPLSILLLVFRHSQFTPSPHAKNFVSLVIHPSSIQFYNYIRLILQLSSPLCVAFYSAFLFLFRIGYQCIRQSHVS